MTKKCFLATLLLALCMPVIGWSDYRDDWGPAIGVTLPPLEANDHTGTPRNLANLAGERGLLLLLSRSADW
ncbi:MAG: hypothetical protein E2O61_15375 [Gammaproteobacteria bacterium]|nr:MAG: hypothetical protein E2O61_15375 [Gammaproteobacteria bacterium]